MQQEKFVPGVPKGTPAGVPRGKASVNVAAMLSSPENVEALTEIVTGFPGVAFEARAGGVGGLATELSRPHPADLVLVEIDLEDPQEISIIEQVLEGRSTSESPLIVAMTSAPTVEGVRRLMRLGILDVLPQPLSAPDIADALKTALDRAAHRAKRAPADGNSRVVSFLKACGGVGATTVATEAAIAVGDARAAQARVCLIDLDLQFGAAAIHLDLPQNKSALDLLEAAHRLDGDMLRSATVRHPAGFDLLAAPQVIPPLDAVNPADVAALIAVARAEYETILIDLPQAWTAWTRATLAESDHIVLVLGLDVQPIRQARRQIETIAEEGLHDIPLTIIANRVAGGFFRKGVAVKEAQRVLGHSIEVTLPDIGRAATEALNAGQPLGRASGGRRLTRKIERAIRAVLARAGEPAATAERPRPNNFATEGTD